jgi:peptide/nickel transport system ATP-binding protein
MLEVKDLSVSFRTTKGIVNAVDGISFSINNGETLGIVGESGSGKSVTCLSLMRLLSPNAMVEGEIGYHNGNISNTNILTIPDNEIRMLRGKEMAMIFQEPMTSLNPVFTCGEQIDEAILVHHKISKRKARERTIGLLENVKLPDPASIYKTYPHQLSGGQRQRVMIAMALSCNPSLLIADEPTSSLDVTVQSGIIQLLQNLRSKYNMGMIFVSHDLGVISEVAEKVIVMYKGKIVEHGNVKDIFSNPSHPYTRGLLSCRPPLDKRLRHLPVISDFTFNSQNHTKIFSAENIITQAERKQSHEKIYSVPPLLKIENLSITFPRRHGIFGKTTYITAVDNVRFDVFRGETLGIVGESGSGKTTLGRAVLQLIKPHSGKVLYENKDLNLLGEKEMRTFRKRMQIIFQDPYSSLNPKMKIGDAILQVLKVHRLYRGKEKQRVLDLLGMVSLNAGQFDLYPHEFSGGQRQRICIARALATEPEILICDECVSALDVSIQSQILNLLNELKRSMNLTCIFISHDLSVVKFMSDRMLVMSNGRIVEEGDPDEIYLAPKTSYSEFLINAIPGENLSRLNKSNRSYKDEKI